MEKYKNEVNELKSKYENNIKSTYKIKEYYNGEKYDGEWKNGKNEGKGIYYYKNVIKMVIDMKVNIKKVIKKEKE